MTGRYADPRAFRTALEARLKARSRTAGLPLDRIRKEAAFQRLLARMAVAAPAGSWALKGGQAMIARAGEHARATADADATWRVETKRLDSVMAAVADSDLGDGFQFLIGQGRPLLGEGTDGALRFPIQARLAGRLFEPIHLDINLAPHDPRPVEELRLRNLFAFADLPAVVVPAISPAQQLAEKLHAYVRDYGTQVNTRVKDLYDMLIIADDLTLPGLGDLTDACAITFALRATPWPLERLDPPPPSWAGPWAGFVATYRIRFADLDTAYQALTGFWQPVLDPDSPRTDTWSSCTWSWRRDGSPPRY